MQQRLLKNFWKPPLRLWCRSQEYQIFRWLSPFLCMRPKRDASTAFEGPKAIIPFTQFFLGKLFIFFRKGFQRKMGSLVKFKCRKQTQKAESLARWRHSFSFSLLLRRCMERTDFSFFSDTIAIHVRKSKVKGLPYCMVSIIGYHYCNVRTILCNYRNRKS